MAAEYQDKGYNQEEEVSAGIKIQKSKLKYLGGNFVLQHKKYSPYVHVHPVIWLQKIPNKSFYIYIKYMSYVYRYVNIFIKINLFNWRYTSLHQLNLKSSWITPQSENKAHQPTEHLEVK